MKQILLITIWCFAILTVRSQSIQNLSATYSDGKVIVSYDVVGSKSNQTYFLDLYSSHNNFSVPLKQVSGDVGKNIRAGIGKRISWDAASELVEFSGELTFKVKGELMPLPLLVKNPLSGNKARRGKTVAIEWEGGKYDQNVRFDLYKGNDKILGLGESKNSGRYAWLVPKDFEKGTYSIRIMAGEEIKQSGLFAIRPRVPFFVKILPVFLLGGAGIALSSGGESGPTDLPVAPNPK